jgi:uncharacterized membrane protein YGL010W
MTTPSSSTSETASPLAPPEASAAPQRRVQVLVAHYGQSHTQPLNELIHFIAIPAIMFSLVGALFWVHPWVAYGFVAASLVYYARLSALFFSIMLVGSALMLHGIEAVVSAGWPLMQLCAGTFVVAWIFQFIGHKIEGKKPSFFEDIQYLWVGPLFLLAQVLNKLKVRW